MTTLTDHHGDQMEITSNHAGGANVIVRQASRYSAVVRIPVADIRAALDKIDPPKIANQERNREALVEHIAEQDRILRRRNEQIARQAKQIENQARNAEEAQWAIEAIEAERDEYRAMHSEQMKTIIRLQKNPRPLTADDITDEMVERGDAYMKWRPWTVRGLLAAALTEPTRPEGAEELQALIRQAEAEGEGADNEALANYLAARLIDPTVKEQS